MVQDGDEASALAKSEARYRAIVEDQTELICRFLPDGTYTFVNEAYCRYFESSREELLGKSFFQFIPVAAHPEARAHLAAFTPAKPVAQIEHEVVAPNGEIRWQQWRDRGFFDDQGKLVEFQAVGRDITERVRAERALEESGQQLRMLANHVPVHIWMHDERGSFQFMNARFLEYAGASRQAPLHAWTDVVHPEDAAKFADSYHAALEARAGHRAQVRLQRHDGEYHWFDVIGLPRFEGERLLGYLGCSIDITEQRLAELQQRQLDAQRQLAAALREADRRKDEFLSMLSHELRSPLAPIVTALELLRTPGATRDVFDHARDVIARQVGHLRRLVDDLVDVARISRGTINVELETLDLRSVIAHALETSQPAIAAGGHRLAADIGTRALLVRADPVRLSQIVSNLLNNAAEYGPRERTIGLSASAERGQAVLRVTGTAVPLSTDTLERAFEPFAALDRPRERPVDSLGLGLTLVKRLVDLHGGRVGAFSSGPDQGHDFVVRLPLLADAEAASEPRAPVPRSTPRADQGPLRILIVDDNVDYTETLAKVLEFRGHDVCAVPDGPSAIAATARMTPDIVLLDLGLPGMDGIQVAERLRRERRCGDALMVAITAYAGQQEAVRLACAGFDHHLVKPVDIEQIETLIAERA
jgi:PAS domain S-box-containing protein